MNILKITMTVLLMTNAILMANGTSRLEDATDWQVRNGLPNVAAKFKEGKEVTVVWIGGSITQCGENGKEGYVVRVSEWLQQQYPNATIRVVNAGISGTGSDFGAKRFDRDVLEEKPDLVLVEFCVNDGDADRTREMERMVHKAWLHDPTIDIAFFYTLADRHLEQYKEGKLPFGASCHERVAANYGIPTIGTAKAVADSLQAGEIEWKDFANDGCHPNADGYGLFLARFEEALPKLLAAGKPGDHKLAPPLSKDFQVYPPRIETKPLISPTFTNAEGKLAIESFSLPVIGIHWVGEPQFDNAEGKTLWRLAWMDREKASIDNSCGLERKLWDGNEMEWFPEDKCFTGAGGQNLIRANSAKSNELGLAQKEAGVLLFIAPKTGMYEFKLTSSGVKAWESLDKVFSLQIARFIWGKEKGESLAFYKVVKKDSKPFEMTGRVELTAGEEIAFIPATDAPWYIGGGWGNMEIGIGYFGPAFKE